MRRIVPLKQKLNALEKENNPYVGVLQVLNVVMEGESTESQEQDEMKLFYVQAKLNGKSVIAMVDSGATHNFLREDMVQRLGLQPEPT
jgi:predicted aspartyl protease